jgi:DNA replication protein DnaC
MRDQIQSPAQLGLGITTPKRLKCPKHGDYNGFTMCVDGTNIDSECDKCAAESAAENLSQQIAEIHVNKSRSALVNSCIPPRFANNSFYNWNARCEKSAKIKTIIEKYITHFDKALPAGTSFLFCGNTGTGKTHLACAIANNVMRKGYTALYISSLNYISKIKTAWATGSEQSEDALIESFVGFDLLIFDELGKGELSVKEKGMIFRLIDRRYEECKPTIGISKHNKEALKKLIDDDAIRRLEAGGGTTLVFDLPNYQDSQANF